MFIWCAVLFALGIISFMDSIVANNEIFGRVSSVFFMLISLGLLIRTTTKLKTGKLEHYEKRIYSLEKEVQSLKRGKEKIDNF